VGILESALDVVKAISSKWTVSENSHGVKRSVLQSSLPLNSLQTRRFCLLRPPLMCGFGCVWMCLERKQGFKNLEL